MLEGLVFGLTGYLLVFVAAQVISLAHKRLRLG